MTPFPYTEGLLICTCLRLIKPVLEGKAQRCAGSFACKRPSIFFSIKNIQLYTLTMPIPLTPGAAGLMMVSDKLKDFWVCGVEKQRFWKADLGRMGKTMDRGFKGRRLEWKASTGSVRAINIWWLSKWWMNEWVNEWVKEWMNACMHANEPAIGKQ